MPCEGRPQMERSVVGVATKYHEMRWRNTADRWSRNQPAATLPRNPLTYHEKSLGFAMDCSGLQYLATLA
jgi:hypothetical protein